MINDNENKAAIKNRSHRYDMNRPRPRHGHKYTKYKMCLNIMMVICTKQHLSNIWNSIHEKIKQLWGWVKKKMLLKESFFCHSRENLRISDLSFNVYHIHMFSRLSV